MILKHFIIFFCKFVKRNVFRMRKCQLLTVLIYFRPSVLSTILCWNIFKNNKILHFSLKFKIYILSYYIIVTSYTPLSYHLFATLLYYLLLMSIGKKFMANIEYSKPNIFPSLKRQVKSYINVGFTINYETSWVVYMVHKIIIIFILISQLLHHFYISSPSMIFITFSARLSLF